MDGMTPSAVRNIMDGVVEGEMRDSADKQTDEEMRMKQLSAKLVMDGREDEVQRALTNEDYRQALYDEFEL